MDESQNGKQGLDHLPNEIWLIIAQTFAQERLPSEQETPHFRDKQNQNVNALKSLCLVSKRARVSASIVLYDTVSIWRGPIPQRGLRDNLVSMIFSISSQFEVYLIIKSARTSRIRCLRLIC